MPVHWPASAPAGWSFEIRHIFSLNSKYALCRAKEGSPIQITSQLPIDLTILVTSAEIPSESDREEIAWWAFGKPLRPGIGSPRSWMLPLMVDRNSFVAGMAGT